MTKIISPNEIEVGVVGLGLMGSSIVVSLLLSGHKVTAIAPILSDLDGASKRIREQLMHSEKFGLLKDSFDVYLSRLSITADYSYLKTCSMVLECVIEKKEIKKSVYAKIEAQVSPDTVIATNTSAIPISLLQKYISRPERFLGIHWAEPAYATRFLEITCGDQTSANYCNWIFELAHYWSKEPTILKKDIRGFITNRLMYAVYREALYLFQNGEASLEDLDKAFKYDAGSWMTLMGIFKRMDMIGLKDYPVIFKTLFSKLCNQDNIPFLMQEMIDKNGRGVQNLKGLYKYTEEEARQWEEAFAIFNIDIYHLAEHYASKPR